MPKDRLVVSDERERIGIYWECYDEELGWELGAALGERLDVSGIIGVPRLDRGDWEWVTAETAAAEFCKEHGVLHSARGPWEFDSFSQAKKCLRHVKLALKQDQGRELPEWAKTALAAGWKPPKGWKA